MIKTVSLQTAKLLKEEGFPQETALFYRVDEFGNVFERNANEDPLKMQKVLGTNIYYAKHTTDELLEELPDDIITIYKVNYGYQVSCDVHQIEKKIYDKCLPEALAQMWLYLKKSNLLSGREVEE